MGEWRTLDNKKGKKEISKKLEVFLVLLVGTTVGILCTVGGW